MVVMLHSQVVAETLKPATTNDLVTALRYYVVIVVDGCMGIKRARS